MPAVEIISKWPKLTKKNMMSQLLQVHGGIDYWAYTYKNNFDERFHLFSRPWWWFCWIGMVAMDSIDPSYTISAYSNFYFGIRLQTSLWSLSRRRRSRCLIMASHSKTSQRKCYDQIFLIRLIDNSQKKSSGCYNFFINDIFHLGARDVKWTEGCVVFFVLGVI